LTIPLLVAAFELFLVKMRALCTASALFMTGHRRAVNCRFVIAPPPGDRWVVVDMERRVAAEVFLRKGHMPLDCRKSDSMMTSAATVDRVQGMSGERVREEGKRSVGEIQLS
jgi:hypothetical protein